MKSLVNSTPTEFMRQTARIAKAFEKWVNDINWDKLKKENMVIFPNLDGMEKDEKVKAYADYKAKVSKASRKMLIALIQNMFEKNPDETGELLALACFVEPEEKDQHLMPEYLKELTNMLEDESVIGFFTSLVKSGLIRTSK